MIFLMLISEGQKCTHILLKLYKGVKFHVESPIMRYALMPYASDWKEKQILWGKFKRLQTRNKNFMLHIFKLTYVLYAN